MGTLTSQNVQQYVRVFLYWAFGMLASYGVTVPDNNKALIISIIGTVANLAWTMYGTRLNGLLQQVKEKTGVEEINIKVNPDLISPDQINKNTSPAITATAKGS